MEKDMEKTVENTSQHDGHFHVQAAKIRSVTTVLTAVVVVAGLIGVAFIITRGTSWIGKDCPVSNNAETTTKMADGDMAMDINLMQDGEMFPQRFTYNYESNTVLIEAANFSQNAAATFALDFDRRVVFINLHELNECFAFQLPEQMSDAAEETMEYSEDQIIDITTTHFSRAKLEINGEIPYGYVQKTNGPIIRGMCSGQTSYWSDFSMIPDGNREKRWSFHACLCIGKVCVEITIAE